MIRSVDGHLSIYQPQKKKKQNRDEFIEKVLNNLENNTITLNDVKLIIFEETDSNIDAKNDDNNNDDNDDADNDLLICEICCINRKSILLVPCNHYKLCNDCYEKIKNKYVQLNVPILCPVCRQIVEKTTTIYL